MCTTTFWFGEKARGSNSAKMEFLIFSSKKKSKKAQNRLFCQTWVFGERTLVLVERANGHRAFREMATLEGQVGQRGASDVEAQLGAHVRQRDANVTADQGFRVRLLAAD